MTKDIFAKKALSLKVSSLQHVDFPMRHT